MSDEKWVASAAILCPASSRVEACSIIPSLTGSVKDATPDFWTTPIYEQDGTEPSYYLAHCRFKKSGLDRLEGLKEAFPELKYMITDIRGAVDISASVESWLTSLNLRFALDEEEDT